MPGNCMKPKELGCEMSKSTDSAVGAGAEASIVVYVLSFVSEAGTVYSHLRPHFWHSEQVGCSA
jgi:hypothetical protein